MEAAGGGSFGQSGRVRPGIRGGRKGVCGKWRNEPRNSEVVWLVWLRTGSWKRAIWLAGLSGGCPTFGEHMVLPANRVAGGLARIWRLLRADALECAGWREWKCCDSRFAEASDCIRIENIRPAEMPMFTPEERARLRSSLLEMAQGDPRITGAAITGSAAASGGRSVVGHRPRILSPRHESSRRSRRLDGSHVRSAPGVAVIWTCVVWRVGRTGVFLLSNTLQVDLAFVVDTEFRALAPDVPTDVRQGE